MLDTTRGRAGTLPSLLFLLAAPACGDGGPPGGWVTTRDTLSSGAVRVTHVPPADPAPTWTLVEELRVGTVDGGGPASFGQLKGLVALEGGGFAVLESQAAEVRVFAADGSHVATYGRRGEGPGEFRDPHGLMVDPEGRLWVPDSRNVRMSVFLPNEGFVESFRFNSLARGWVWTGVMAPDGHILKPSYTGDAEGRRLLRVFDLTMNQVDSIFLLDDPPPPTEDSPAVFRLEVGREGSSMMMVPFYSVATQLSPAGARWSTEAGDPSYRIQRKSPEGTVELEVVVDRPPVPVTASERDSVIDEIRESIRERGGGPDPDWSKIPKVKPSVESLFFSAEGNLWVRTTPSGGTAVHYDVFGPEGAYLGMVAADPGAPPLGWFPPVVVGDAFWVVLTGELDEPYVVRARITRAR